MHTHKYQKAIFLQDDVHLLFRHKNKIELQVDLGDLDNEKERLSSFLQSNLQVSVTSSNNKLTRAHKNDFSSLFIFEDFMKRFHS